MTEIQQQIDSLMGIEDNAFISNNACKKAASEFYKLVSRRGKAIIRKLRGELLSTWDGQKINPDKLVAYKEIDLKLTGANQKTGLPAPIFRVRNGNKSIFSVCGADKSRKKIVKRNSK